MDRRNNNQDRRFHEFRNEYRRGDSDRGQERRFGQRPARRRYDNIGEYPDEEHSSRDHKYNNEHRFEKRGFNNSAREEHGFNRFENRRNDYRKNRDNEREDNFGYRGKRRNDDEHNRNYNEGRERRSKNDYGRDSSPYKRRDDKPYKKRSNDFRSERNRYSDEETFRPKRKRIPGARPVVPAKPKTDEQGNELIRLNKYIANAGVCSRREADKLIETGTVTVNGEIITEMGYKVTKGDVVCYDGQRLNNERKVYILLNKPKGYITTTDDPQGRKTVLQLVQNACKERIYPVGRLDRNTTGLLLFTNDGDLAKKLTHPSSQIAKIYHVEVDKPIAYADMQTMLNGVELEDGFIQVDAIEYQNDGIDKRVVGVEIHSGKNRIIRRLFESFGYDVVKLDRVCFGGLTKKLLPRGTWRFLTPQEIGMLMK